MQKGYARALEKLSLVRKRFRKDGSDWIKEPDNTAGSNALQTTAALNLNFAILSVSFRMMMSKKVSVKILEPQARDLPA